MSFQRHKKRNEIWFVSKGSCLVKHSRDNPDNPEDIKLSTEEVFHVKQGDWHQLINPRSGCMPYYRDSIWRIYKRRRHRATILL
jgi:mannose-6-phosphate isomerase-like protein (cupin superfamily)